MKLKTTSIAIFAMACCLVFSGAAFSQEPPDEQKAAREEQKIAAQKAEMQRIKELRKRSDLLENQIKRSEDFSSSANSAQNALAQVLENLEEAQAGLVGLVSRDQWNRGVAPKIPDDKFIANCLELEGKIDSVAGSAPPPDLLSSIESFSILMVKAEDSVAAVRKSASMTPDEVLKEMDINSDSWPENDPMLESMVVISLADKLKADIPPAKKALFEFLNAFSETLGVVGRQIALWRQEKALIDSEIIKSPANSPKDGK